MCFFNYFKTSKQFKITPPNTMHPEMVKIIRLQYKQYRLNKLLL